MVDIVCEDGTSGGIPAADLAGRSDGERESEEIDCSDFAGPATSAENSPAVTQLPSQRTHIVIWHRRFRLITFTPWPFPAFSLTGLLLASEDSH